MERIKELFKSDESDIKREEEATQQYIKNLKELLTHDCNRGKKEGKECYCFEPCADIGVSGCHELGEFFQIVERDMKEASNYFTTNCEERNYKPSCFSLGYLYFTSKEKDYERALKYFQKGCGEYSPGSCNNAAMILLNGHEKSNISKDINESIKYFETGCDYGHSVSCFTLSTLYLTGNKGIPKDLEKAHKLTAKSCDLGHPWACANLSRMYQTGDGVEKDETKAKKYRQLAEELNKTAVTK
eukprot:gene8007-8867_t